ncbi:hemagglutinin-related protein [Sporocytophaga myxococcoides]|uniref:Hemagglutinin-related protein n=1 Tax=Sporocytophaga myxococcoides TaxID=153721 RepID=A0A098LIL2_9BACT|nr:hypothetical protein [Sporocytophaga myxococcoides]GAL86826.1 hemagglutinin-related protein [Sporocytophaga myxococcoides]
MKLFKTLLYNSIIVYLIFFSFHVLGREKQDTIYINEDRYDKLLKETIVFINKQKKSNEKEFHFDLRKDKSRISCNPNLNSDLKSFYERPPQTLALYTLFIDTDWHYYIEDPDKYEAAFSLNSDQIYSEDFKKIKQEVSNIKKRFIEDVARKSNLGEDGVYVVLALYTFSTEPAEENIKETIEPVIYFDRKLQPDVRDRFFDNIFAKDNASSNGSDCDNTQSQCCNIIIEQIHNIIAVLNDIKNASNSNILSRLSEFKTAPNIISLINSLASFDIEKIPYSDRIRFLKILASYDLTDNNGGEKASVSLLQYAPLSQAGYLIADLKKDKLYLNFINKTDDLPTGPQDYTNLIFALYRLASEANPFDNNWDNLWNSNKVFRWNEKGVNFTIQPNASGEFTSVIHVREGMDYIEVSFDPFSSVGIISNSQLPGIELPNTIGYYVGAVPAIYLYWLKDKAKTKSVIQLAGISANFLALATGIGVVGNATTSTVKIIGVLDVISASTALTLDITSVESYIENKFGQSGSDFISNIHTILTIYNTFSVGANLTGLPKRLDDAIIFWKRNRKQIVDDGIINKTQIDQLDGLLGKTEEITALSKELEELISRYTDEIQSLISEFEKSGAKLSIENGNILLIKGIKGDEIGKVVNGKFIVSKWGAYWKYESVTQTECGYKILKSKDGDLAIDLGFKEGRNLTSKEVNEYLIKATEKNPTGEPYFGGTYVTERLLEPGEKIYCVEYSTQLQPGGWISRHQISTVKELREKLAVLQSWKDETKGILVVREYEIVNPTKVRDGIVGPQLELTGPNAGQTYPGGGHQYEVLEGVFNNKNNPYTMFFKLIGEQELK